MAKKVLVIDDEVDVGTIVRDFLDDLGYETEATTNARHGLELIQKNKPDLVLLDVVMPEMSGLECLRKIREIDPSIIVIVVSGMQDESIAKEAIQEGAYDYITKPFDMNYLQNNLLARIFE